MSHQPMTIVELVTRYPSLFYSQQWWRGESFTRMLPTETLTPPPKLTQLGKVPNRFVKLPHAVDLLNAYVKDPTHEAWLGYLWTADTDVQGQRVYIGGRANGHGLMEIHRHIHVTERFAVPKW